MGTKLVSPSTLTQGIRFRPSDHTDAYAVVIEPVESIIGTEGKREMVCNVRVFDDKQSVEDADPIELNQVLIGNGYLYRQLAQVLTRRGLVVGRVRQGEAQPGGVPPWIITALPADALRAVSDVLDDEGDDD